MLNRNNPACLAVWNSVANENAILLVDAVIRQRLPVGTPVACCVGTERNSL